MAVAQVTSGWHGLAVPTIKERYWTSRGRKLLLGWVAFVVLLALGVWGARRYALGAAVHAAVRTAREISEILPERHDRNRSADEDLLFPLWPVSPEAKLPLPDAAPQPEQTAEAAKRGGSVRGGGVAKSRHMLPPLGPPPISTRASVKQVLHWAENQIVPRGVARPAGAGMPAGIELHDVGGLGLGLLPGDRLVTVDGISVLERSQVVGAVLGARSRRAEAMTAGLVRRTKAGPVHFTVVVEQPYPEDVADSVPASDSSP